MRKAGALRRPFFCINCSHLRTRTIRLDALLLDANSAQHALTINPRGTSPWGGSLFKGTAMATIHATVRPEFNLGRCCITPGAQTLLEEQGVTPLSLLHRHVTGDWGDLSEEDKSANTNALAFGQRLLSCYELAGGKVYVITEWDRSATTILLPSEY